MLSRVPLSATPWTVAHQAPLAMGILQARILEWLPSSKGPSQLRDGTQASRIAGDSLLAEPPGKPSASSGKLSLVSQNK